MSDLDIKKTYYYNNRPVKLLQKTSSNMYLVCANTSGITTNLRSDNFCQGCIIGDSDNKISCTCEEAEIMIEDFIDEIKQDDEVFWVPQKLLKDQYFEQKRNDELLANIDKMKNEKIDLTKKLDFAKQKELTINNDIEKTSKELSGFLDRITNRTKDLHELEEEITEISTNLKDVKIVSDMGISIKISLVAYKELLISESKLQALEIGGVDNWDWYSEALYATNDSEKERDHEKEAEDLIKIHFQKALKEFKLLT